MRRYFVEGRVLPERLDLNLAATDFDHEVPGGLKFQSQIYVVRSKTYVHIKADENI
jgi:hypothetical protein